MENVAPCLTSQCDLARSCLRARSESGPRCAGFAFSDLNADGLNSARFGVVARIGRHCADAAGKKKWPALARPQRARETAKLLQDILGDFAATRCRLDVGAGGASGMRGERIASAIDQGAGYLIVNRFGRAGIRGETKGKGPKTYLVRDGAASSGRDSGWVHWRPEAIALPPGSHSPDGDEASKLALQFAIHWDASLVGGWLSAERERRGLVQAGRIIQTVAK